MTQRPNANGKEYWRSLDQLEQTPEFREFLYREFPQGASEMDNRWSRRSFLTLMGASVALAGLAGCRRPVEKVVPYVTQPEEVTPGVPQFYATTMPFGLSAYGLLVKSNEGRPTKIEGNERHPATMGASNIFTQAAILGLYDPDRSRFVMHSNAESSWDEFVAFWQGQYARFKANGGEGLAILSESFNSPTLARLWRQFRAEFPKATLAAYEPISDENIYEGVHAATGQAAQPLYDFGKARVILSLDSDFLHYESDNIKAMQGFADGRRIRTQQDSMNRLYVVESRYSVTGTMADHRLRMRSGQVGQFLLTLMSELRSQGLPLNESASVMPAKIGGFDDRWIQVLARDLMRSKGSSLVVAGRCQPPAVHALVASLNQALANNGSTVSYSPLNDAIMPSRADLSGLVTKMNNGSVDTLVMLGGNPNYNAPVDLAFDKALAKVPHAVHLSQHRDETSRHCEWHLPRAHFLEMWGDARCADSTASLVQPLIEPLYGSHSEIELLSLLATGRDRRGYEIVRETWQAASLAVGFEKIWRTSLHDGVIADSALSSLKGGVDSRAAASYAEQHPLPNEASSGGSFEILFAPSHLFDGRFANNGWLQELPDSVTKLSWDNVACVSNATAKSLGVANGDMVRLQYQGRQLDMPIWITPGHADQSVAVVLGYGRTDAGRVAENVGFNTYLLRGSETPYFGAGLVLSKLGSTYKLANVQDHGSMEGRPIVREATLDHYQKKAEFFPPQVEHPPLAALWDPHKYDEGYQWGMSIDLNACTGCNACTVACQSENNIPIVGKEQVANGREMHWIRLDRYFAGDIDDPEAVYQPMACQHCENAPCENVCPVAATVHDKEGLNVMVYNRCIGTRYCSNNCPYKVRRFNFFNYTKDLPETVRMQQNPDVTVRSRGVMEKCTYCIQRINAGKYAAKKDGRTMGGDEVVTACQQACPAKAIVFGNINDPESSVSKLKKLNRDYAVLEEFFTKPRTTFLAKLRNPNPEMEGVQLG